MAVPPQSVPVPGTDKPTANLTVRVQRTPSITVPVQRAPDIKSRRQFT
jgi:hypothetical protein